MKNSSKYQNLLLGTLRFLGFMLILLTMASCTSISTTTLDPPEVTQTVTSEPTRRPTKTPNVIATEPPQETLEVTQTPSLLPEDLNGIVIHFVHPWAGSAEETLENIAMEFSLTNPYDIWVEVNPYGSENLLLEGIQDALDVGEVPELIAVHPVELSQLTSDISFVDVSEYFSDPNWGFAADEQADIPEVFLGQFSSGDRLLALPVAPQATVLFYNQSWAEELGYSAQPMEEAQFRAQSCAATYANRDDENEDNDGTGGWVVNFDPKVLLSWYHAFGGPNLINEPPFFNNESGEAAFGFLKFAYDQGCIWIGRQSEPFYYFSSRYALMYAGTLDQIPIQTGWMNQVNNDDNWISMGFPGPIDETMFIDGPGLMITESTSETQIAAWLFAKYLLEPEVQAELVRSMFTLPVRNSSRPLLNDFESAYPQWAQAADMIDSANFMPLSDQWGIARWLLQDAIIRLFSADADEKSAILEQLDTMILEMSGMAP